MKKAFIVSFAIMGIVFVSCQNNSGTNSTKDTATAGGPDSAANNGILPPPGAPSDANNSSLADTTYKSPDSLKTKTKK